ncbi:MAG: MarR family transcriptional regulator [Flavobacteriales bacterium]|jgi:DNA-binding MarR family transcriptional regulator|nr:MarR family transcriptional regulator [Flavobacteriales bacterium]
MDEFLRLADQLVIYQLRSSWFQISKLYNEMAVEHGASVSMAFILLAINDEEGTPVTKIAPRLGMEPNSLSRILKSMEEDGFILRNKDRADKRLSYVCLTPKGKEKREVALKAVYRLERAIVKQIDEKKLSAFFEVASHIPDAIEEFKEKMASYENS